MLLKLSKEKSLPVISDRRDFFLFLILIRILIRKSFFKGNYD